MLFFVFWYHQYPVLQCARAHVHDRYEYIEQFSINFVWIDFIAKSYRSAGLWDIFDRDARQSGPTNYWILKVYSKMY